MAHVICNSATLWFIGRFLLLWITGPSPQKDWRKRYSLELDLGTKLHASHTKETSPLKANRTGHTQQQEKDTGPQFDLVTMVVLSLLLVGELAAASANSKLGRPWVRHAIDDSSRGADGVRLRDVDGNGLLDIVAGWERGGRFTSTFTRARTK